MQVNKQITEAVQFESGSSNRGEFGVGVNLPPIAFQFGYQVVPNRDCAIWHDKEQV